MCTVTELIEKLKELPPHTKVNVLEKVDMDWSTDVQWVELDLGIT